MPADLDAAYDIVFERMQEFASRAQSIPAGELPRFDSALRLLRRDGVAALERADFPVSGLGVFEALLARSWAVRFDDPAEMCALAKAAVEVAKDLRTHVQNERELADLRAKSWGELGNAYRVADQLRLAESAFAEAFRFLELGTGDGMTKARLYDLEASLLGTLREFSLARERLTLVPALYRELGEPYLAARALITKALYTFYSGEVEDAILINHEAFEVIDEEEEPGLVLPAVHNHLLFLTACDRYREAKRFLFENRPRLLCPGRISVLKLRGIEGRISYGLGELKSAELAFREAKEGFDSAGLHFARALIGLDLALTYLRQRRPDDAEEEVRQAIEVFQSLKIHREVLGSILILNDALRLRQVTVDLLDLTVRYIRKKTVDQRLDA